MARTDPAQVRETARSLGLRLAAAGASAVALLSLLRHAPLWLASALGLATLIALGLCARLGVHALGRALACEAAAREESRSSEARRTR